MHKFSTDGSLEPLPKAAPARQAAPQERKHASLSVAEPELAKDPIARLQLRIIERLTTKGLLDGEDLMYIFGNAAH